MRLISEAVFFTIIVTVDPTLLAALLQALIEEDYINAAFVSVKRVGNLLGDSLSELFNCLVGSTKLINFPRLTLNHQNYLATTSTWTFLSSPLPPKISFASTTNLLNKLSTSNTFTNLTLTSNTTRSNPLNLLMSPITFSKLS